MVTDGAAYWDAARLPKSLDPIFRTYPGPIDSALRDLKRGVSLYSEGRYAAALLALPPATAASRTAVADYVELYRGKSFLALEKAEDALRSFRELQSRHERTPLLQEAILGEAQSLLKLREPLQALKALENPRIEADSESLYFRARANEDAGSKKESTLLFLKVYSDFPLSKTADLALEHLVRLAPRFASDPSNLTSLLQRAENLLRGGKARDALAGLVKIASVPATSPTLGDRRWLLTAQAELDVGRPAQALLRLKGITDKNSELHAEALYLEAQADRKLKREDAFLSIRDVSQRRYPNSPATEKVMYSVATYFDVGKDPNGAREAYQSLLNRFPSGEHAQRARWKLAIYTLAEKKYGVALQRFWEYLQAYPDRSFAAPALFWMARCYERLGDTRHALSLYERVPTLANENYYGQRAREAAVRLGPSRTNPMRDYAGIDFNQVAHSLGTMRPEHGSVPEPSSAAALLIERARQLDSVELEDLALKELRKGMAQFPAEKSLSYMMSRIFESEKRHYDAIVTLRRAFPSYDSQAPDDLPDEVWRLLFPVLHWKTVSFQAEKNRVDPALVLAIIRQESAFSEGARSHANARGLMQILPSTGRQLARTAGIARYNTQKLYTADANLTLGIRYFADALKQFEGRIELALAAYNAGNDRVEEWMKEFGEVDMEEFVERIPFTETRNYVRQVLTNRAHYRRITSHSAPTIAP